MISKKVRSNSSCMNMFIGGPHGVMVIVIENGHVDINSNPRRDWLHFTWHEYPWEGYESNYSPSNYG